MKKFLLAGASTLALLGFAGGANAQLAVNVDVDISETLGSIAEDTDGLGGFYINAAVNDAIVDGSVAIDTDGLLNIEASLLGGVAGAQIALNASRIGLDVEASTAAGLAITPGAGLIPAVGLGTAAAVEVGLDIIGTSIASTGEIATTAIGAVNTGVTSLAALSTSDSFGLSTESTTGANIDFNSSAADSASNTSNTAARAAAAATSLLVEGATSDIASVLVESTTSGPAAIVAANLALNNALVDGSVSINDATTVAIAGTATTAIGAVNTGTITNGLPGSITIVAGDTSSTTTTNTNVTTPPTTTP